MIAADWIGLDWIHDRYCTMNDSYASVLLGFFIFILYILDARHLLQSQGESKRFQQFNFIVVCLVWL
jgi:hypothetical protein